MMFRVFAQLMIFATLMVAAQAASNEVILTRKGNWTSSFFAVNGDGVPMCNTYTRWAVRGSKYPIASLHTKYTGNGIFIQLYKKGWAMPDDVKVEVRLSFEDRGRFEHYNGKASSGKSRDGQSYLELSIDVQDESKFISHFAEADRATLTFPEGDEPDWTADMYGSRDAIKAFLQCMAFVDKNKPTQPTGRSQPTQPTSKSKTEKGQI